MEFLRNAHMGFGAGERFRVYDEDELEEFLDTFAPLFDVDNIHASPLGRALTANHALHDRPLGEVLFELTGQTDDSLLADLEGQPTVTPGPSLRHLDRWTRISRWWRCATAPMCCARQTPPTTRWTGSARYASPGRERWLTRVRAAVTGRAE